MKRKVVFTETLQAKPAKHRTLFTTGAWWKQPPWALPPRHNVRISKNMQVFKESILYTIPIRRMDMRRV
jgi:hypothetical protein